MIRIFIGYDAREDLAYRVLKYSLEKHSSQPLEIRPLVLQDLDFARLWDPLQSTEFTYTRFLVPHLCRYEGCAIFMDCDMLSLGDIAALARLDMTGYALRVFKHAHTPTSAVKMDGMVQSSYPRKNWSSLMVMNCARLRMWTKEAVETKPAAWLHRFEPIADDLIGDIPDGWNVLDRYDEHTQLLHYTEGGPWFEAYRRHPFGNVWLSCYEEYTRAMAAAGDPSDMAHADGPHQSGF
jgi:lipopolysaccharide biosynthesis glycosyltransferase